MTFRVSDASTHAQSAEEASQAPADSAHRDACRAGCGACCIAPSISSPIPGMPHGKPAGKRCIQLDDANLCRLFGDPRRPLVCERFRFDIDLCGSHRAQAIERISALEIAT